MKLKHMRSRRGRRGGKMFRNGDGYGVFVSRQYGTWNDLSYKSRLNTGGR